MKSEYEIELETLAAPDDDEEELSSLKQAAHMLREALRLIADVSIDDQTNGVILLSRMAGLSLAEIGSRMGMSKQAVHKRVVLIVSKWPPLADAMNTPAAMDEHMAGPVHLVRKIENDTKQRQEATRWMQRKN